jgi:hypothetical protein
MRPRPGPGAGALSRAPVQDHQDQDARICVGWGEFVSLCVTDVSAGDTEKPLRLAGFFLFSNLCHQEAGKRPGENRFSRVDPSAR